MSKRKKQATKKIEAARKAAEVAAKAAAKENERRDKTLKQFDDNIEKLKIQKAKKLKEDLKKEKEDLKRKKEDAIIKEILEEKRRRNFIEEKTRKDNGREVKEDTRRAVRKQKLKNLRNELKSFTQRDEDPNKGLSYIDFFEVHKKKVKQKKKDVKAEPLRSYNEIITFQHIPTGQVSKFNAFVEVYRDSYTCNWQSTPVFGRMDPIMSYGGTKRAMSLNFKIMSASAKEAYTNIQNLQVLIRSLYPTYNRLNFDEAGISSNLTANTMGAAPLVRVAWSNLVSNNRGKGIIAAIQSLSVDPIKEVGMIGLDETLEGVGPSEKTLNESERSILLKDIDSKNISTGLLPLGLTVSLSFQVLHDYSLGHFDSLDDHFASFPYGLETDSLLGEAELPPEITNSRQFLLEETLEEEVRSRSFKSPQRARDQNILTALIGSAFDSFTGE